MVDHISFVEHYEQGNLRLVENGEGIEHVAHEGVGVLTAYGVRNIKIARWE